MTNDQWQMMPPRFLYFDLGKVLLDFDAGVMCRQIADVAGIDPARVRKLLYDDGLQRQYELGRITTRQFYEAFCQATGTRPDYDRLVAAASDIFQIKPDVIELVGRLGAAGHRLGILSNTCEAHWEHCWRRFPVLEGIFGVFTLSYQVGAMKPDPAIFRSAADRADVKPHEVFFTDDTPGHVTGAKAAGFDAVIYTSPAELTGELRRRGVAM